MQGPSLTAGLLLQVIISGLAAGAVYALIGTGYGLIQRTTGVLNFAHGDMVSVAIFAFLLALGGGQLVSAAAANPLNLVIAVGVAIALSAAVAVTMRELVVEPFARRHAVLGWVAGTAAVGLLLRSLLGFFFTADSYSAPDVIPLRQLGLPELVSVGGGASVQLRTVVILVVALATALTLDLWLTRSLFGRAMRASAESPDGARLVGISPRQLQLSAWLIAGILIAIAGLMIAPTRPLNLTLGVVLGLKGIAAAVIGRLGNARGAVLAGLGIGLLESVVTNFWMPALHDVLPLLLLVLVLTLAPARVITARPAYD